MLEVLVNEGIKGFAAGGRRLVQWAAIVPAGLWIAALVVSLVAGRAVWDYAHRPAHLDALAEESGNLGFMIDDEKPRLNHAGNRLLFCHSSENGIGVFVCDVATGQKKMLFEEKEIHFGMGPHGVLTAFPWSPDDHWFVYAHQGPGGRDAELALPEETALTVCRADTDEQVASLIAPFGRVVALEWLSPEAFVYVSGTEGRNFVLVEKQSGGGWNQSNLDKPPTVSTNIDNRVCALAAVSSDTVVWLQANCLWTMNVKTRKTEKLIGFAKDRFFSGFDYSSQTRQFLLSSTGGDADSLWRLPLDKPGDLTQIGTDTRTHDNTWNDAVWINSDQGYAFIRPQGNVVSGLVVKTDSASESSLLFKQNRIEYLTPMPDGRHLLVVGDINGEPGSGIWEYTLESGASRCIVAAADQPLKYLKQVQGIYFNLRLSPSEKLNVVVYPPANYDRHHPKKYPVVIGSIRYAAAQPYLSQYAEAVANAGAFFVTIDHTWSPKSLDSWAGHVLNVRNYLVQFPIFDRDNVFLLSNSAQSRGLMKLLAQNPGLCKGAILFVPGGGLPPPSDLAAGRQPLRILVTTQSDFESEGSLKRYQLDACADGMFMDYRIHPDTPHQFVARRTQRDRIRLLLHFIFDG